MAISRFHVTAGGLALSLVLVCGLGVRGRADDTRPFRIGLTATMMPGVNTNDAMAALAVWGNEIAAREQLRLRPQTMLLQGADDVRGAIDEGRIDLVLMSVEQHVVVNRPKFGQVLLGVRKGNVREEFLVLVKKGNTARLADLKGKSLLVIDGLSYDMSMAWLESELHAAGLGPSTKHFSTITHAAKVARGVLPV